MITTIIVLTYIGGAFSTWKHVVDDSGQSGFRVIGIGVVTSALWPIQLGWWLAKLSSTPRDSR